MNDDYNKDRLGKIVALAKYGTDGEKENALRIVKRICQQHNLDFDSVMGNDMVISKYEITWTHAYEKRVLGQIIGRFTLDTMPKKELWENHHYKTFHFETTKEKYIETVNAWDVLRKLYKKEREKAMEILFHGFLAKHRLYAQPGKDMPERPLSREEIKARVAGHEFAKNLDDADLYRRLPGS